MNNVFPKYLVDINHVSNGEGIKVYGNKLDAYSFKEINSEDWFNQFSAIVEDAIGKKYLPIYRIADGELRFLFGYKINFKHEIIKNVLRYAKYKILNFNWKTSWGEHYNAKQYKKLRQIIIECLKNISESGIIALYWNENGLNAFTEYNIGMLNHFKKIGIYIHEKNYYPFHFVPALITHNPKVFIQNKRILIISSLGNNEINTLSKNLHSLNAKSIYFVGCSATAALEDDYTNIKFDGDIVFVAAGVGAAKVLSDLKHLNCPVIDIGSYIHVLSGKLKEAHAGFFTFPK